jgi:hypothetical protein
MRFPNAVLAVAVALVASTTPSEAPAKGYVAPKRSVAQIVHAIGTSHPSLPAEKKTTLARLLVKVAREENFDALSGWAIIDHESDWRANAVSADGQDIGLAQIRYTTAPACREDRDSEACLARKEALFDPLTNIRAMAGAITAWRRLCEEKTGRAPNMKNWLAGYGGYSRPSQDIYCGRKRVKTKRGYYWKDLPVPKPVQEIIDARKVMIKRIKKDGIR